MILLIIFAFFAGIVTILSPCILPILPIVLSSSVTGSKTRPLGIIAGFILSFTFFTLFLSTIVANTGISANALRIFSIIVIATFGASLLIPKSQQILESLFSKLSSLTPKTTNSGGFVGGVLIGLSIGLLWTPCVGPILASVIALAISGSVSTQAVFITFSYAVGTAIPMLIIMYGGQNIIKKVPWLLKNTSKIQKVFGVLMIVVAIGIYFNLDRKFQTFILNKFPNYGVGLTQLEDTDRVKKELYNLSPSSETDEDNMGKPMFDLFTEKGKPASELIPGGQWFNSEPLTLQSLRGKVVIVDFWTYSCINCQRTFPYLKSWYEKYKDEGLVIIGVHSPEFEFEKDANNVREAISDFGLKYPVVQDNNFDTWRAYNNRFWPAKYIIDKDGYIRYTHFGEGKYKESEEVIRKLLEESGAQDLSESANIPKYNIYSKTPETYLGHLRISNLASYETIVQEKFTTYSNPPFLPRNSVALEGEWLISGEYSTPKPGSKLYIDFDSKEVFLVAKPKNGSSSFKVLIDGEVQHFGEDNKSGIVTVESDKLYKIINLLAPGRHNLELQFEDSNIELYAFTFG